MSKEKPETPNKKSVAKGEAKKPEKPQKKAAAPKSAHPKPAAKSAPKKSAPVSAKAAKPAPEASAVKSEGKQGRPQRTPAERTQRHPSGYRANVDFLRISPTKVRRIADNLRRKPYVEVMALLDVLPHKGARLLRKVIQSAAANALAQNKGLDEQMLVVKELLVDGGPTMKRMWARGRGRADRLLKRSCHIFAVVGEIGGKEVDNGSKG